MSNQLKQPKRVGKVEINAPGPSTPQMFRDLLRVRKAPAEFLVETRQRYGDVVQFPVPTVPVYYISHPSDVDHVLRVNARNYGKRTIQYENLALVTGDGLLAVDTPGWRRQRRLVQPAFHHEAIARVGGDTAVVTDRLLREWAELPDGSVIDADDVMMHAGLEVVSRSLFGTDLAGDVEATAQATLDALDVVVARARTPIAPPPWVPSPLNRKMSKALAQLDSAVGRILTERKGTAGVDREPDMLDLLIAANATDDEGGSPDGASGADQFSDQELRDQIVTFLVAGHETVASSLTWTWWLIASHPDVQARIQKEVDEVLAGKTPTVADAAQLVYLRAVVDEALRLYPPGWVISRRAQEADVIGGVQIPADSVVIISPWATHRHPAAWANASSFDPSRFLPDAPTPIKGAYIPFGSGPRFCIGKDFALLESVLLIARVMQFYSVATAGAPPRTRALVMARPADGLPIRITRR
jgi:cytochrome P450